MTVIAIVAVIAVAGAGCAWYIVSQNDTSPEFAGEWKATSAYGYDSQGRAFHYEAGSSALLTMNKDITYAKDNVLLMKCGEFSRTGVYDGNEIWVCFGTETGHERYYRLYNEGCLYITSFNSADEDRTILWSVLYTRDGVMPDTEVPSFDLTISWKMVDGNSFDGTARELSGDYLEFTSFNGNAFIGTMEQESDGEIVTKVIRGYLYPIFSDYVTCEMRFMDDTGFMWGGALSDGNWLSVHYIGASELADTDGSATSTVRNYTPDGTGSVSED